MPEPIPLLERADGKPIKDDFKRYHFNIAIESVLYEAPADSGTIRCAILLNINFDVKGNVLAYALVPLTTGPQQEQSNSNDRYNIHISEYLPHNTEWVQTGRHVGTKDISATPNVSLGASGYSVSISGMGVNSRHEVNDPVMISLRPIMKTYYGSPIQLDWEFENKDGPFYPSDLKILIIVEKQIEYRDEVVFPFTLKLSKDLEIKAHRTMKYDLSWLIPRFPNKNHDGWVFQISGNYRSALAKDALRDAARPKEKMKIVGLHAATDDWYRAQQMSAGKVPHI